MLNTGAFSAWSKYPAPAIRVMGDTPASGLPRIGLCAFVLFFTKPSRGNHCKDAVVAAAPSSFCEISYPRVNATDATKQ